MRNKCHISNAVEALLEAQSMMRTHSPLTNIQVAALTTLINTLVTEYGPEYFSQDEVELINRLHQACSDILQGETEDE